MARSSLTKFAALIGLCIVALAVLRVSVANGIARSQPQIALAVDPSNADAAIGVASQLFAADTLRTSRREVARLASAALRRDPTKVEAASLLGLVADADGNSSRAKLLMDYAESVSRRDQAAQLWLIEAAVHDNDLNAAIVHYDIALRTSKRAPAILFPILAGAIDDPAVANALAARMHAEPNWAGPFLYELARQKASPPAVARLFETLARQRTRYDQRNAELFIQRAVAEGDVLSAWSVYQSIEPAASREQLRDGNFANSSARVVPFEWELTSSGDLVAVRERAAGKSFLRVQASTGAGGVFARQLVRLTPGTHVLSGEVSNLEGEGASRPYITVRCSSVNEPFSSTDIPNAGSVATRFVARLSVPAGDCTAQWVELWIRASYEVGGLSAVLSDLTIR